MRSKEMQEINWGNFTAKFNGKEQKSFEWLCYLLFCKEFKQSTGIFRYLNQAGIETDPIKINDQWIGWQAKFYTSALSNHKDDFIKSINNAKAKHPKMGKIIFYLNQDFPQGKKQNDPQYKISIENHAQSKGIMIIWRTASFFESPFVIEENANIAQHFFSLGKGIIDCIGELSQHTETILKPIHSTITFNDSEIKIDRTPVIENIKVQLRTSSILILSGEAGVGKTAVLKDFYSQVKRTAIFYVFKATEFNLSNVNQLFNCYGDFTMSDFIREHDEVVEKYVIIDSAEKLSDIDHKEVFQEFLMSLVDNSWKIIFTTRYSYLDDLKYQFVEVFNLSFHVLIIEKLTKMELEEISRAYKFILPRNNRLSELFYNPFYLNEYLRNYHKFDITVNYSEFKNILWNEQIQQSAYRKNNMHIKREDCFLRIAQKKATDGRFFVKIDECDDEALIRLESDEIIKYDTTAGGYFITHDIYEEWALDKVIERAFHSSGNYKIFYKEIGSSLPVRRAFRNWLSEKLYLKEEDVKAFIENSINDDEIEGHWRDEVLVSILLSDFSESFFTLFENKFFENDQALLVKCIFLLRIACKEIDEDSLHLLGLSNLDGFALKTLLTKPKGTGWNFVISLLNKHKKESGLRQIDNILPLLSDWNNKTKEGETTKNAAQLGLFYYDEILKNNEFGFRFHNETKKILISIILNGSKEIKDELSEIIDNAVSNNEVKYGSEYYDLFHTILSSVTESYEISKTLPEHVIKLADISWFQDPDDGGSHFGDFPDVEQYFCVSKYIGDYFPSSSFQTPIFNLLRFSPNKTVDFILNFTNRAVECYSKSKLDNEIKEVMVTIDDTHSVKQYISDRLWKMYRGTHVATNLLESVHMALERWLLEVAEKSTKEVIESWCLHLITNSRSTSITAVVTSIVLAQPSKLFNIASILFRTKLFFFYDKNRWLLDLTQKSSLLSIRNAFGINYRNEIFEAERIESCDAEHRKCDLESLAFQYQFFLSGEESLDGVQNRQMILWNIFDKYYEELPENTQETDDDKTWRLFLARMDLRKMQPKFEEKDGRTLISFTPNIEPGLKKYSEDSQKKSIDFRKHSPLRLWSAYKYENDESKYKQYPQFENDINAVISEIRNIIDEVNNAKNEDVVLMNHSIPAYTCSVLVRDYFDRLESDDKKLCKNILIENASIPLRIENYQYQISDGTEPAIASLPYIMNYFPDDNRDVKLLLFLLLLTPWSEISVCATRAILNCLWKTNSEDAHSFFLGYIKLKPKYKNLRTEAEKNNYAKGVLRISEMQILEKFTHQYETELDKFVSNRLINEDLDCVTKIDIGILISAFELLPLYGRNEYHERFIEIVLPLFAQEIFLSDNRSDYAYIHRFMEKFAYCVLNSPKPIIHTYLKTFVQGFTCSRYSAEFLGEFITVEDKLNKYDEFWIVWNEFYEKIVELCEQDHMNNYDNTIIHNYLLAWPYWKDSAKDWHSLKDQNKAFFSKVAQDLGYHPAVLYSLSKVINDIGSNFIEDGILWISSIFQRNPKLLYEELETNTIYYLENLVRRYISTKRQRITTNPHIKGQLLIILDFLITRGSATGYLLREDIL